MDGLVKGFTGTIGTAKGIGVIAAVFAVLVALYAFAPAYSPQGVASQIRGS